MGEGDAHKTDRGRFDRSRGPVAIAAIAGVLALAAFGMASCGDRNSGLRFWQRADAASNACPRPLRPMAPTWVTWLDCRRRELGYPRALLGSTCRSGDLRSEGHALPRVRRRLMERRHASPREATP